MKNQQNFDQIRTWSGVYSYEDISPTQIAFPIEPKSSDNNQLSNPVGQDVPSFQPVLLRRIGNIEFTVDVTNEKLFVDFKEDIAAAKAISLDNGEEIAVGEHYIGNGSESVMTPDSITMLRPLLKHGPIAGAMNDPVTTDAARTRLAKKTVIKHNLWRNDRDTIVDPRRFFAISNQYVWEQLGAYADALAGKLGDEMQQTAKNRMFLEKEENAGGRIYILTVTYGVNLGLEADQVEPKRITRFGEDLLPLESTMFGRDGKLNSYRAWQYEELDGICIPKEFHYSTYFHEKENFERHLTMRESTLNGDLGDETFQPSKGFTLDPGDRLYDEITKEISIFDGNEFVPPSQYRLNSRQVEDRGRVSMWWLTVNIIVVAMLLGAIAFRRYAMKSIE